MPSVSAMPWSAASAGIGNLNYQAGALQPRDRAMDRIAAACAGDIHIRHIRCCDCSCAVCDLAILSRRRRGLDLDPDVERAAMRESCAEREGAGSADRQITPEIAIQHQARAAKAGNCAADGVGGWGWWARVTATAATPAPDHEQSQERHRSD